MADVGKVVKGLNESFDEMMAVLSGLKDNVDISVPVSDSSSSEGITPVQDIVEVVDDHMQERLSKINDFIGRVGEFVRTLVIPCISENARRLRSQQNESAEGMLAGVKQDISSVWYKADKNVFINFVRLHSGDDWSSRQDIYSVAESIDKELADMVDNIILSIVENRGLRNAYIQPERSIEDILNSLKASCIDWSDMLDEQDSDFVLNELELGLFKIVRSISNQLGVL